MDRDAALQRLIDEAEIRAVTMRVARGYDRLDWDLVRSCFHPDARIDHGVDYLDVDGLIAEVDRLLTPQVSSTHFVCNQEYDFASAEIAYVESTIISRTRIADFDGAAADAFGIGRYNDRFEKREGRWLIAERVTAFLPSRVDPVQTEFEVPDTAFVGRRGAEAPAGIPRPETLVRPNA